MNNRSFIHTLRYVLAVVAAWCACMQVAVAQSDRQYIRNGNKLYRQQNYARAEIEYRKALAHNRSNSQAMYNLGCALLMQQKDSAAVQQLEQAGKLEQAPRRKSMVYHNIGVVCQKHQLYGEAIEAYKESLRSNPSDNETRYNLALCQRLLKNQKKNGGGQNNKDKNKKNDKDKQKQKQQQQNQDKKDQNKQQEQQQQPKDQMSKENAEQLLNYAVQEEKATQQRMKQQQQRPQSRRLQKNW